VKKVVKKMKESYSEQFKDNKVSNPMLRKNTTVNNKTVEEDEQSSSIPSDSIGQL
jgi:uncharacterized membrane protein